MVEQTFVWASVRVYSSCDRSLEPNLHSCVEIHCCTESSWREGVLLELKRDIKINKSFKIGTIWNPAPEVSSIILNSWHLWCLSNQVADSSTSVIPIVIDITEQHLNFEIFEWVKICELYSCQGSVIIHLWKDPQVSNIPNESITSAIIAYTQSDLSKGQRIVVIREETIHLVFAYDILGHLSELNRRGALPASDHKHIPIIGSQVLCIRRHESWLVTDTLA